MVRANPELPALMQNTLQNYRLRIRATSQDYMQARDLIVPKGTMSYLVLRELSVLLSNKKYNSNDDLVILEKVTVLL